MLTTARGQPLDAKLKPYVPGFIHSGTREPYSSLFAWGIPRMRAIDREISISRFGKLVNSPWTTYIGCVAELNSS
jgi:hypothetical protein